MLAGIVDIVHSDADDLIRGPALVVGDGTVKLSEPNQSGSVGVNAQAPCRRRIAAVPLDPLRLDREAGGGC